MAYGPRRIQEFLSSFNPLYFIFRADLLEGHMNFMEHKKRLSEKLFSFMGSKEPTKLDLNSFPTPIVRNYKLFLILRIELRSNQALSIGLTN